MKKFDHSFALAVSLLVFVVGVTKLIQLMIERKP